MAETLRPGGWWTRFKARRSCGHEWELVDREEVPQVDGRYPLAGAVVRMQPVDVYRCRICGKRMRDDR